MTTLIDQYRDPLPRWISEKGRLVLIGDSAVSPISHFLELTDVHEQHPFLPTSIQGAVRIFLVLKNVS